MKRKDKRFSQIFRFFLKQRGKVILLVFAILGLLTIWVSYTNNPDTTDLYWWAYWVDPIIGFGTFLIALAIGWFEFLDEWEDNIPKRFDVIFYLNNRNVIECRNAFLTSEADLRQLGQQIGKQMARCELPFEPYNIITTINGKRDDEHGGSYMHYTIKFQLRKLPEISKVKSKDNIKWVKRFEHEDLLWEISNIMMP